MKNVRLKIIIDIILVLLSMIMIFIYSSENAEKSNTTSIEVAEKVISVVYPNNQGETEQFVKGNLNLIRKIAHITEYALLGFLLLNLFKDLKNTINYKLIIICILISFIYAIFDEFHQTLIIGRNGNIIDTLIDTTGAVFGISIYYVLYKLLKRKCSI